jgi:hypothetical protein
MSYLRSQLVTLCREYEERSWSVTIQSSLKLPTFFDLIRSLIDSPPKRGCAARYWLRLRERGVGSGNGSSGLDPGMAETWSGGNVVSSSCLKYGNGSLLSLVKVPIHPLQGGCGIRLGGLLLRATDRRRERVEARRQRSVRIDDRFLAGHRCSLLG